MHECSGCTEQSRDKMASALSEETSSVYKMNTVQPQVAGGSALLTVATATLRLEQRCAQRYEWDKQPPIVLAATDRNPRITYKLDNHK